MKACENLKKSETTLKKSGENWQSNQKIAKEISSILKLLLQPNAIISNVRLQVNYKQRV